MREIKFRQPRLGLNGNFMDWHYWGFIGAGFISPISFVVPNYQYTGLKDKNGKEIYEGDRTQFGEVVWVCDEELCEDVGWFIKDISRHDDIRYHSVFGFNIPLEIIGNIYENPELL